jgi:hypothetical protein
MQGARPRPIMARMKTRLIPLAVLAACAISPAAVSGLTIKSHEEARRGDFFTVRCGQTDTVSWKLPKDAQNVKVTRPQVGDRVEDGFGRETLATITAIDQRTEGGRSVVDFTATGSHKTCEPIANEYEWETTDVVFKAEYDLVREVKVLFSDEQGGLNPQQKPKRITATYDTGWEGLDWQSWGGKTAVGKGRFVGREIVVRNGDADYAPVVRDVQVKLSRVRICGNDRHYYTKLKTKFLEPTPGEVQRQAKPPGTAGCLD